MLFFNYFLHSRRGKYESCLLWLQWKKFNTMQFWYRRVFERKLTLHHFPVRCWCNVPKKPFRIIQCLTFIQQFKHKTGDFRVITFNATPYKKLFVIHGIALSAQPYAISNFYLKKNRWKNMISKCGRQNKNGNIIYPE